MVTLINMSDWTIEIRQYILFQDIARLQSWEKWVHFNLNYKLLKLLVTCNCRYLKDWPNAPLTLFQVVVKAKKCFTCLKEKIKILPTFLQVQSKSTSTWKYADCWLKSLKFLRTILKSGLWTKSVFRTGLWETLLFQLNTKMCKAIDNIHFTLLQALIFFSCFCYRTEGPRNPTGESSTPPNPRPIQVSIAHFLDMLTFVVMLLKLIQYYLKLIFQCVLN